ncbi:MAG TPA: phage baseplate assembly protein V [Pyrinomonadaceae bacterium]|jgi:uncharacterized protein involved in type VI secretion and phage assembly|nr:phage baseplate assembly protein V [Pyrinomonadaceae bacterium]
MKDKIPGVVVGLVTDNQDPEKTGRLKLKFPTLDDVDSPWAPVAALMSGNNRGGFYMPEVGDEVLVSFDQGRFDHPYVVGFLWNGKDKPPSDDVKHRLFRSVNGHEIDIYDPPVTGGDKGYIRIKDAHGNIVELSNAQIKITSPGTINIQAPNVIINGRAVVPQPRPI